MRKPDRRKNKGVEDGCHDDILCTYPRVRVIFSISGARISSITLWRLWHAISCLSKTLRLASISKSKKCGNLQYTEVC